MLRAITLTLAVLLVASQALAQPPADAARGGGRGAGRAGQRGAGAGQRGAGRRGQRGPQVNYDEFYKIGPDSMPQEGVPKGQVIGPTVLPSEAYSGTQHMFWIYVPAQYDPAEPASLMVFQDGHAFFSDDEDMHAQHVMDNLIYRRELPVMIAVFINPGRRPDQQEANDDNWGDGTTNRSTEYNVLDDRYAQVVVNEILPYVKERYNISDDPERRGIGGISSGAIAAFTVAWQRPDQFHKVLSIVGSFVNLRGGDAYPDIVRESEKKPLRVFLQDGRNDMRRGGRGGRGRRGAAADAQPAPQADGTPPALNPQALRNDWFYQNTRLAAALEEKGYDVNYVWGIGVHGSKQGGAIFPEMMRWLWRDHPVSVDPNDQEERSFHAAAAPPAADQPASGN